MKAECRMQNENRVAGLDYGILSGFPAIANATIFVAPYRVKGRSRPFDITARVWQHRGLTSETKRQLFIHTIHNWPDYLREFAP